MDLLSEWKRLLSGTSDADQSEFEFLIPHDATEDWLRDAFGTLPNGHIMIQKIGDLLKENTSNGLYIVPKRENYIGQNAIEELALDYRDNVVKYLNNNGHGEVAREIHNDNFIFVHEPQEFLSMAGDSTLGLSEAEYEVDNDFIDKFESIGEWTFALHEAVLFLTKSYVVTRYILEEVIPLELNSRPFYELWRGGGNLCFMKSRTLLLCRAEPV